MVRATWPRALSAGLREPRRTVSTDDPQVIPETVVVSLASIARDDVTHTAPHAPGTYGELSPMSATPPHATQSTPRPPRPQAVLAVERTTTLTPHLVRLRLGGSEFAKLRRNHHTDAYVKLLLPHPGSNLTPPYDLETLRTQSPQLLPAKRTYTVRHWHDEQQAIEIDVVLHDAPGAHGIASAWASAAQSGDRIALMGAGGAYTPEKGRHHLLIGDHSALPAIAAALEHMNEDAYGIALIHLEHADDRIDLTVPDGIEVRWLVGAREQLLTEVAALSLPSAPSLQVFCHAERGLTKALRAHLVTERGIPRPQISISAYWALGRVEDEFQAEKREDIGRIDP